MTAATSSVLLPESIVRAAEVQARLRGISLEQWVARVVAERLDTLEGAREFFQRRSSPAVGDPLARALDAVPSRAPDLGDEL